MKKVIYLIIFIILGAGASTSISSCKTGYGCPAEEQYKENQSKALSKKRGKSRLFKEKN
jgi:hypothetical protein